MNPPKKNKFVKVALITFGVALFYFTFGLYLFNLWPYHFGFQEVSFVYGFSLMFFFGFVGIANLYSLSAFIWAKWRRKAMHQFIIIGPIILLMILALFAIKPYMPRILPSGSHLSAFNSEIWISDSSLEVKDGITERQKMVGDVVEHILPGKTRNDIIRLLGLSSDDSNQPTLLYYLGPARGDFLRMHTESLEIFFNPSGRYEKYTVIVED